MSAYDNTYLYKTNDNKVGIVRSDSLVEAAERINDYYNGARDLVSLIKLSEIDNDYGVVEFS